MGLLEDCQLLFATSDLYALLSIGKTASEKEIKRSYRKLSLQVHPDRATKEEQESATKKFQVLSKVSKILLDKDLRAIYDEDGQVDDSGEVNEQNLKDWTQYWKTMFRVTIDDMKKFEATYKGSTEEINDLKSIYVDCEGDMDVIHENHLCSTIDDESRLRKILQDAIDGGEIPAFDKFTKESDTKRKKRTRRYKREAQEAEQMKKKLNLGSENDLKQLILQRKSDREKEADSFFSHLEAKYAKPKKAKKSKAGRKKKA